MQFDKELAARGLSCPLPILKTKKALADLTSGQVLKVTATDPGSIKDMQAFANQTGNPLLEFEGQLRRLVSHTTSDLREGFSGDATVGGLVTRLKRVKIKSGPNVGRVMGRFVLEDLEGSLNVTLFADKLQKFEPFLVEEAAVLVRGQVRERGSEVEMTAEDVVPLARAAASFQPVRRLSA